MLRRFEGKLHADDYARYRPTWPSAVFDTIVSYLKEGGRVPEQAIDVGCGTGISTKQLAERFTKVIGIDVSESMLSQAPKDIPNVSYRTERGEDLSFLPPESVDAITCAASIHWLDLKMFNKEVERVLKPGGVLASFTYGGGHHLDNTEADQLVNQFYSGSIAKYFDKEAAILTNLYAVIEQPYKDYQRILDLPLERTWSLSNYLGYVSTVSATRQLIEAGGSKFDQFADNLLQVYKRDLNKQGEDVSHEDVTVMTKWEVKLNISRKPRQTFYGI